MIFSIFWWRRRPVDSGEEMARSLEELDSRLDDADAKLAIDQMKGELLDEAARRASRVKARIDAFTVDLESTYRRPRPRRGH